MYKLNNLNDLLKTINGTPIAHLDNKPLTIKAALISICELHKPTPGSGEGIKAYDLGIKLHNAKDSLEIKEDEVNFLKELVGKSEVFFAVVIGLLDKYLGEAQAKVERN